jgi:hypothetical protein
MNQQWLVWRVLSRDPIKIVIKAPVETGIRFVYLNKTRITKVQKYQRHMASLVRQLREMYCDDDDVIECRIKFALEDLIINLKDRFDD